VRVWDMFTTLKCDLIIMISIGKARRWELLKIGFVSAQLLGNRCRGTFWLIVPVFSRCSLEPSARPILDPDEKGKLWAISDPRAASSEIA
jgi:hypothetical protein